MIAWAQWLRESAGPVALVTVLATEGSAPRGAGTRMVVRAGGTRGTIGGGALEFRAIEQARAILGLEPGAWRVQDYPLGPLLGQCCGGRVRLLIEHLGPERGWLEALAPGALLETRLEHGGISRRVVAAGTATPLGARGGRLDAGACWIERLGEQRRPLYLFGAGHVGQAIARHAAPLPLALAWFDTRGEMAGIDRVTVVDEPEIPRCVDEAPADAAIVILTHDHGLDYRLALAALRRSPVAFVGLIGSATKRARFRTRLMTDGVGVDALARLTCPIGVAGVSGKEPDVIAIAVLAQLLQLGMAAAA